MSTILKALRRLEEQKSTGAERPLRDEVVLAPARSTRRSGWVRAVVAGVVLAAAGLLLLRALAPEREAVPQAAVERPALPAVAAAPPAETTTITISAPPAVAPSAVVPVPSAPREFEIVRPDPSAPARPLAPLPLPTIGEEEYAAEPVPEPAPVRAAPRVSVEEVPVEYVDEPLEEAPEPRVVAKAGSPVRVARTLWHPTPERRLAWVEVDGQTALREVREGERVGPYLVREIEPTAVLFSQGDVEMRREVGP